ncbi:MAG TPA: hemerythrin domain-containing protein [Stellaceae bacterium]|nr:hemerythrin domain-containing protein [Stellaceae bacterium]
MPAMISHTPPSMVREHEELHAALAHATRSGGRTAAAAADVARLLHPHFIKEEAFALPPLGLLPALAGGRVDPAMAEVLAMTDRLAAEYENMLAEHKTIVAALEKLAAAAKDEAKPEAARFATQLIAHARMEEEVSYPAALLVGRYLKATLPRGKHKAA